MTNRRAETNEQQWPTDVRTTRRKVTGVVVDDDDDEDDRRFWRTLELARMTDWMVGRYRR